ncbi:MAG: RagB/SusD family nutrient uptake outer membrane protein [Odoribacter splanchnicus]
MNKIITYFFCCLLVCGCGNFLDVMPKGMVIPQTVEDYELILNDDIVTISNITYMDPDIWLPENFLTTKSLPLFNGYTWADFQYHIDENDPNWDNIYARIYGLNEIIDHIDKAETVTLNENLRQEVKGQAYAERAKFYFALINMYAMAYTKANRIQPGVPLLLHNDIMQHSSRATIGEVYDQILSDLRIARKLVPPAVHPTKKRRASVAGLEGFIAKVYLFLQEPDSALIYSNLALANTPDLSDYNEYIIPPENVTDIYKKQNMPRYYHLQDEIIWQGTVTYNFLTSDIFYSEELARLFDQKYDLRFNFWAVDKMKNGNQLPGYKYVADHYRTFVTSVPELLLLRAECYARTGKEQLALADLNTLREKRFLAGSNYRLELSGDKDILELVKEERRRELAFTGLNWWDLKRYQAYGEQIATFTRHYQKNTYTLKPGDARYVLSIPPYVIDKNPKIKQNPR